MDHPLMENSECAGRKLRRTIQCTICGGVGDWTVLTLLTVLTGLTVVRRQSRQIAAAVRRMNDLTEALSLISEKSSGMFAKGE